jgi:hypothetical protein
MKLVAILHQARDRLGASAGDDAGALRRAYRRAVRQYPPDRDPAEFQRVREAYELLQDPVAAIRQRLVRPVPLVPPPRPPEPQPPAPRGATALGILRLAVTSLPASELLPAALLEPSEQAAAGAVPLDRSSLNRSARTQPIATQATPRPNPNRES